MRSRELKPTQSRRKNNRSHTTDDSGRVCESSVISANMKPEIGIIRENVRGEKENVNEKSVENDVKLSPEINGSVVGGSEKLSKKDKKKSEFRDKEGDGKLPKKEQNETYGVWACFGLKPKQTTPCTLADMGRYPLSIAKAYAHFFFIN